MWGGGCFMYMESNAKPYWNLDKIMALIIGLAITAGVVILIKCLSDVLLPFFIGCFLAYILEPIVNFNRRWTHTKGRAIGAFLTIIEVTVVAGALVYIFLPSIVHEIDQLDAIIEELTSGRRELPQWYASIAQLVRDNFNAEELKGFLTGSHFEEILSKSSSLLEETLGVLKELLDVILTLIYTLFIMIDYEEIMRGFKLIIPAKYRSDAMVIVHEVQHNIDSYFRGQGVVAMCAAVLYCIGFSIVGLPLAIPMGLLVGILYMIPYFQYVTLIPVTVLCLIYSLGGAEGFLPLMGKTLLVYVVSQSICDYILTPHIMGKEMGLNPAVILLSLSVWGSLLGIIGMIIALPMTAIIMTYYERYISNPRPKKQKVPVENEN